jgi:dipeptidyl aminopeptidase/acylaminoacyl peptidase
MRVRSDDSCRCNSSRLGDTRIALTARLSGLLLAAAALASAAAPAAQAPFTIDDYFRLARFGELALSWDGRYLVYSVDRIAPDEGQAAHRVVLRPVESDTPVVPDGNINDAWSFAWIPRSTELAFLSARSGSVQLHTLDAKTGATRQLTQASDGVAQFVFARDGKRFAYLTRARGDPATSLYSKLRAEGPGLLVDPDEVSILDLLDPSFAQPPPAESQLWLSAEGDDLRVDIPGDTTRFFWSANAGKLSVTYVDRKIPRHIQRAQFSSVGVVDTVTGRLTPLLQGALDDSGLSGTGYLGGEWLTDPNRMLIRKINYSDPWVSSRFPDWALVGVDGVASDWTPIETYSARFTTHGSDRIFVEDTRRGVRDLAELHADGTKPARIAAGRAGSSSAFSLSGDLRTAAFVNQSLSRSPEIYIWTERARGSRQLTRENAAIVDRAMPAYREVTWNGRDGVRIAGWVLEPTAGTASKPWPLVTFVHGGPGYAFSDEFAPYFPVWPYPLELLALQGIAVFVPNYRGTQSYGWAVASPKTQDGAPADDIVTGIEQLIANGVADAKRLGVTGQSHGGWLGPIVMTRLKGVRASSFAEGISNMAMAYELMPGKLNRGVHDVKQGASLYDNPQDYLKQSPSLHFDGLTSANLFEGGAQSGAFFALSFAKASERQGLPTETVIYPNSGHNLSAPELMRESAERNLDWFRFWLQGSEDPAESKADQFRRWREMRIKGADDR